MSSGNPLFEQLESRTMLNGNVVVTLVGGVLRLRGDNAGNVVTLTQDGDTVTVAPDATTNLGAGVGNPVTRTGTLNAIDIILGNGSNEVTIDGDSTTGVAFVVPKGVSIRTGRGATDRATLIGLQCGSLNVAMGNGDNELVVSALPNSEVAGADIQATVDKDLVVTGGTGDTDVTIQGLTIGGNATFRLGNAGPETAIDNGANDVTFDTFTNNQSFTNSIGKNLTFTGGGSGDNVTFADSNAVVGPGMLIGGNATIRLGNGLDSVLADVEAELTLGGELTITGGIVSKTITLNDLSARELEIFTSSGNDTVIVHGAVIDQGMSVVTGAGADFVTIDNGDIPVTSIGGNLIVTMRGAVPLLGNDPTAVDNPFPLNNVTIGKDFLVTVTGGAASIWAENLTGRNAVIRAGGVGPNVLHDLIPGSLVFTRLTLTPVRGPGAWLTV